MIAKAINALGGEEALRALETEVVTGKVMVQGMELPFKMTKMRPDLLRTESEFQGVSIVQAYDGETAWWVNPLLGATEPKPMPEDFARSTKRWVDFEGPLVDYENKRHRVEYVGEVETEHGSAYEIELSHSDGDKWRIFIDIGTYLEIKRTYPETFMGNTREVTAYFHDHSDVEGVNLHHVIDGEAIDGTRYKMIFDVVKPNVAIDDAWFSIPEPK